MPALLTVLLLGTYIGGTGPAHPRPVPYTVTCYELAQSPTWVAWPGVINPPRFYRTNIQATTVYAHNPLLYFDQPTKRWRALSHPGTVEAKHVWGIRGQYWQVEIRRDRR